MDLNLNGIKVSISEAEVAAVLRQHLLGQELVAVLDCTEPRVGTEWQGGVYAGLTLHDGQPHRLVLLPGERDEVNWGDAIAWAEKAGGSLPSRIDQLVLWQNMKGQFKETWYWSCEQYAGNESYAWSQYFYYGTQRTYYESSELRARAVRRVPIDPLTHSSI